jgi:hypothetical protein
MQAFELATDGPQAIFEPNELSALDFLLDQFEVLLADNSLGESGITGVNTQSQKVGIPEPGSIAENVELQEELILAALEASLASMNVTLPPITDPALRRLFPDAYSPDEHGDNELAALEFRRCTQSRMVAAKRDAVSVVKADLAVARRSSVVQISSAEVNAWLTTLTNLRLVLASRLRIDIPEYEKVSAGELFANEANKEGLALYEWLGWVLESLLDCLI